MTLRWGVGADAPQLEIELTRAEVEAIASAACARCEELEAKVDDLEERVGELTEDARADDEAAFPERI